MTVKGLVYTTLESMPSGNSNQIIFLSEENLTMTLLIPSDIDLAIATMPFLKGFHELKIFIDHSSLKYKKSS